MSVLASAVMLDAVCMLNDTAQSMYTNTVLLPYLKKAYLELEKELIIFNAPIQRTKSTTITVAAAAAPTTLTLPADFFLPNRLFERPSGSTNASDYVPMSQTDWEPTYTVVNVLNFWAFRNNAIYFPGCTVAREVLMDYERILSAVTSAGDPIDFVYAQNFLAARTAELAARFIGMNETHANAIRDNEVGTARDDLLRMLTLDSQGIRSRRPRFSTRNS